MLLSTRISALTGPVVADIFQVAAEDWQFSSEEVLAGDGWRLADLPAEPDERSVLMRGRSLRS